MNRRYITSMSTPLNTLQKHNSLIVDAQLNSRTRLREVVKSVFHQGEVRYARNASEALQNLSKGPSFQSIYVSSRIPMEQILRMVEALKHSQSKKALLVVTLMPEHQDGPLISSLLVAGASGFICEPFSSEQLTTLISTAKKVAEAETSSDGRETTGAELMIIEAMHQLDRFVELRAEGNKGGGHAYKILKTLMAQLRGFAEAKPDIFQKLVVRTFEKATTKKKMATGIVKTESAAPHPGIAIQAHIADRKLEIDKILPMLKIEAAEFQKILDGHAPLTEGIARNLGRVLGKTAQFWMGLQARYDRSRPQK